MLCQWGCVHFSDNGDFVPGFWWVLMDPELRRTGYFDTVHTSKISINASLPLQNEAWQQQRPDMNKQQCCQQEVLLRVRGVWGLQEWMNVGLNGRTELSSGWVVPTLSGDRQTGMLDCIATIYCHMDLPCFVLAAPLTWFLPSSLNETMETCITTLVTMWLKWWGCLLTALGKGSCYQIGGS